jgi:excisionase family DNA binding protein
MTSSPVDMATARVRLRRLDPVSHALQRAGRGEDAAAVELARDLAEQALGLEASATASPLLTTRQAGKALGLSIQTVRNWVAAGRLPAERRGVRTMIPRQAVLDEISRSRAPAPAPRNPEEEAAVVARRKRLLEALPTAITAPLDALHGRLEHGEELTNEERARLATLEGEMIAAAARILAGDTGGA